MKTDTDRMLAYFLYSVDDGAGSVKGLVVFQNVSILLAITLTQVISLLIAYLLQRET